MAYSNLSFLNHPEAPFVTACDESIVDVSDLSGADGLCIKSLDLKGCLTSAGILEQFRERLNLSETSEKSWGWLRVELADLPVLARKPVCLLLRGLEEILKQNQLNLMWTLADAAHEAITIQWGEDPEQNDRRSHPLHSLVLLPSSKLESMCRRSRGSVRLIESGAGVHSGLFTVIEKGNRPAPHIAEIDLASGGIADFLNHQRYPPVTLIDHQLKDEVLSAFKSVSLERIDGRNATSWSAFEKLVRRRNGMRRSSGNPTDLFWELVELAHKKPKTSVYVFENCNNFLESDEGRLLAYLLSIFDGINGALAEEGCSLQALFFVDGKCARRLLAFSTHPMRQIWKSEHNKFVIKEPGGFYMLCA